MIKSLWTDTVTLPSFPTLSRDEKTKVCIIGGGMAGILCAYFLEQAGVDYILCEADTIGGGATAGTTAVISAQHDTLYQTLMKKFGYTKARLYLEANLHAVSTYKSLCKNIDCDFEEIPACLYSCESSPLMEDEVKALHALGYNARLLHEIPLPRPALAAVEFPSQAQFHPLKFLAEIAKNLNIREHTKILALKPGLALAEHFSIAADKIIVASHFPFWNGCGMFFAKLFQRRSYVLAVEGADTVSGSYTEYGKNGLYFRSYGKLLLVGGGDHRTGKSGCYFAPLKNFVMEHYPSSSERYAWSAQDCISLDGIPYIGPYSNVLPNVYVATGFNEWGMTSSMTAARILTDMVTGRQNKYAGVFSPARNMFTKQLWCNMGSSIAGLLTPSRLRCPHMGCALKWNALDKTWDCPCHGSRFTRDGKLIYNPATEDLPGTETWKENSRKS
ncbi:MAG: FAD-dependent oxidoreductase [Lachnospiraceae bacterium]|nr:FAD-dependent oxidoreductase [Lachnospiraceae bacterium]MBD5498692.1 FAD-dependent oxidoreductase [Lachnospiraceae bacterium]